MANHTANRYLFNAKEEQVTGNLGLLDYGARTYDPNTGRFTEIDPLAEKYASVSPYVYTLNNPIRYIDPDGRMVGDPWFEDNFGNIKWSDYNVSRYTDKNGLTWRNIAQNDEELLHHLGLQRLYGGESGWSPYVATSIHNDNRPIVRGNNKVTLVVLLVTSIIEGLVGRDMSGFIGIDATISYGDPTENNISGKEFEGINVTGVVNQYEGNAVKSGSLNVEFNNGSAISSPLRSKNENSIRKSTTFSLGSDVFIPADKLRSPITNINIKTGHGGPKIVFLEKK